MINFDDPTSYYGSAYGGAKDIVDAARPETQARWAYRSKVRGWWAHARVPVDREPMIEAICAWLHIHEHQIEARLVRAAVDDVLEGRGPRSKSAIRDVLEAREPRW